jgi:hypothetical protein
MSFSKWIVSVMIGMALLLPYASATAAESTSPTQAERLKVITAGLEETFEHIGREFASGGGDMTVRDLAAYAFFRVMVKQDRVSCEKVMRAILRLQDMRADSADYGYVPWNLNNSNIKDTNSIEFGTHFWGPMLLGYSKELSPEFVREMKVHAGAALVAIQKHHPPIGYTNIFLMNSIDTILLAEAIGDHSQEDRGKQQLAAWIKYTSANGVREFDSPIYTGVALNDLSLGVHYTTSPEVRAELVAVLDYLWKDVALNMSPTISRTLLGAHSRDYDFLRGAGGLDIYAYAAGLTDVRRFTAVDPEKIGILDYTRPGGFEVDAARLRRLIPETRTVTQRWGEDEKQIRYTYITPEFAVGTANGDYGPQDKMFAVDMVSQKNLPTITLVPDKFDAPYGVQKTKDQSGHEKPTHIPLHPAFLQKGGSVLGVLDLDLDHEGNISSAATNLILPEKADEIRLNETLINTQKLNVLGAGAGDTVGVQEGGSCFAFRFLSVDAVNGSPARYQLRADLAGREKGAIRFAAYHLLKAQNSIPKNLHVAFAAETGACGKDGLSKFMGRLSQAATSVKEKEGILTVRAMLAGSEFVIVRRSNSHTTLTETIDGVSPHTPPLAVNGEEIPLVKQ